MTTFYAMYSSYNSNSVSADIWLNRGSRLSLREISFTANASMVTVALYRATNAGGFVALSSDIQDPIRSGRYDSPTSAIGYSEAFCGIANNPAVTYDANAPLWIASTLYGRVTKRWNKDELVLGGRGTGTDPRGHKYSQPATSGNTAPSVMTGITPQAFVIRQLAGNGTGHIVWEEG